MCYLIQLPLPSNPCSSVLSSLQIRKLCKLCVLIFCYKILLFWPLGIQWIWELLLHSAATVLPFSALPPPLPLPHPQSDPFFPWHSFLIILGFLWFEVFRYLLLCVSVSFHFWVFSHRKGWRYVHSATVYIILLMSCVQCSTHLLRVYSKPGTALTSGSGAVGKKKQPNTPHPFLRPHELRMTNINNK